LTTADTSIRATPRLDSLTSLRFAAALLVVLNHLTRDGGELPFITHLFTSGTAGVGFFFALSGFVLTWSARQGDTPGRFYRRRFARVYPLHLLTFFIAIPVLIFVGQHLFKTEVLASPLMLSAWFSEPGVYFGMNAPSWSLSDETLFYACFPLVIFLIRRFHRVATWVVLGIVVVAYFVITVTMTPHLNSTFWLYVFPPFRLLGFIAGCCAARLIQAGLRIRIPVWLVVAVGLITYVCVDEYQYVIRPIGHGVEDAVLLPVILLVLMTGATSDLEGRSPWLRARPLVKLGEWSFALYLTHWLLLQTVVHVFPQWRALDGLGRGAVDLAFICVAVGVAALAYTFVEKPLERRLRGPGSIFRTAKASRSPATLVDPA
jgi:peptidoglycan/LPS O-acetylase OafA/YrhL